MEVHMISYQPLLSIIWGGLALTTLLMSRLRQRGNGSLKVFLVNQDPVGIVGRDREYGYAGFGQIA